MDPDLRTMHTLAMLMLLLAAFALATKDPLNDFCRRFGHQTAVIDRRLYIDGGLLNWNPLPQNPGNFTNTGLLYNDLDVLSLQDGMPQLHDDLNKSAAVPSVEGGVLWADDVNKVFYLFGGEYYQSTPDDFTLWMYDTIYDTWNQSATSASQIERVSYGAGLSVNDTGIAYYYGGWLSNQSVPGWGGQAMATSNLIIFDMIQDKWTNNTGPDGIGRAEGAMVYIPASDGGQLIYFGGISTPYGNETVIGEPMQTIHIYDIANAKWYNQTASGQIPEERRRFCAGVTWAQDQSSYNIYLYGGMGMAPNTTGFDDVYILSVPSFTWIKWYGAEAFPHHSLSCNVIDGAQMLIIGGTFETSNACDAPDVWGTHNLNLGKNDPTDSQWAVFEPNVTSYNVPPEIVSVVGGSPTGGATLQTPSAGFSNRDLAVYYTRKASVAVRTATRALATATGKPSNTPAPKHRNIPAIVGASVGGAALAIVAALTMFCCMRRLKARKSPPSKLVELPASVTGTPLTPYADVTKWGSKSPASSHALSTHSSSPPPLSHTPEHPANRDTSPVYVQPIPGYYHQLPPVQPYYPPPGTQPTLPAQVYSPSQQQPAGQVRLFRWASQSSDLAPPPLKINTDMAPPVPEKQFEMPAVRTPKPLSTRRISEEVRQETRRERERNRRRESAKRRTSASSSDSAGEGSSATPANTIVAPKALRSIQPKRGWI